MTAASCRHALLVGLVSLLLVVMAGVPQAQAAMDATAEAEFVRLVNAERTSRGLAALTVATDLTSAARDWSNEMANQSLLHHNPELGTDVTNWQKVAENVGKGPTVSELHDAFMNSPSHREAILSIWSTQIGVGVEVRGSTLWVTKLFRLPETASTSSDTSAGTSGGEVPLVGDWDGDGKDTPGWFESGRFRLSNEVDGSGTSIEFSFGRAGDIPLAGDWDGDGKDTIGVVRDGTWMLRDSLSSGMEDHRFDYGRVGSRGSDIPLVGDWDGDGKDTIGIVREGEWHLRDRLAGGSSDRMFVYGRVGPRGDDRALIGDWDGDGKDTVAIVRNTEWHLRHRLAGGSSDVVFTYGNVSTGDIPLVADVDGDGIDRPLVVNGARWFHRSSFSTGSATSTYTFG